MSGSGFEEFSGSLFQVEGKENDTWVYETPVTFTGTVSIGVMSAVYSVIGISCNSLVIHVVRKTPSLIKNTVYMFVFSLSITDLLSALANPLFWYTRTLGYEKFDLPVLVCKVYWGVEMTTILSTSFHIISYAYLRYKCLVNYNIPRLEILNRKEAKKWINSIWTITGIIGFLYGFGNMSVSVRDRYSNNQASNLPSCGGKGILLGRIATIILTIVTTLCSIVVSVLSGLNLRILKRKAKEVENNKSLSDRQRLDRRSHLKLIEVNILMIGIGYCTGYLSLSTFGIVNALLAKTKNSGYAVYISSIVSFAMLRLSQCLNPLLYNMLSCNMREATKMFISDAWRRCWGHKASRNQNPYNVTAV